MGVIFAQHIADYTSAFAIRAIGGEPQLLHGIENSSLHGFEPITCIGQGPTHDHAHGVLEIGALHLLMQGDWFNALLSHALC